MEKSTPMMRQYHRIKRAHPDALLFFRLGDFYEMFYEDAVIGSRELEITLTSRNKDRDGGPIPMCGIPYHAASNYLSKLLKRGYKVAICDQVEDPRQAKGIVRREVTRILTPGTTIEEGVLDSKQNNFVAALYSSDAALAASFLDVSTGEFWTSEFRATERWEALQETLAHFQPAEIVVSEHQAKEWKAKFRNQGVCKEAVQTPADEWTFHFDFAERLLLDQFNVSSLEGFGLGDGREAISAAGALLHYVRQTQKCELNHITTLSLLQPSDYLKMDDSTVQNLELVRGMDGNRRWTLFSTLDHTRTGMGARLLRAWILRPSFSLEEIDQRLDAVEELSNSLIGMKRLGQRLDQVHDLERLLSRVTLKTANARDLLALRDSIAALPGIQEELQGYTANRLSPDFDRLADVGEDLFRSIRDDPPATLSEGGLIRPGYHKELDELREIAQSGKSFIAALEAKERERTGINSLKVKFNRVFGYFIEVTRAHLDSVPSDYIRKQTLAGSERYVTPELKEYEEKVLGAEERIVELERELFLQVRERVASQAPRIRKVASILARLDVLLSFAEVSAKNRYIRPQLEESAELVIRNGRHPVLELERDEPFVPNDLVCNTSSDQMLILTGPNMGGKSTFLRQNALIVIMAQMGCFVPADEAKIGLVDRIFTRVGASDNLARGQSTFMVEMIETARILNTATPRSFILLDEVGRGTATFDGLSIAWAVAEYLIEQSHRKARTLFATHYQELTRLEEHHPGVRNYCVTVKESAGRIIFFHRVQAGVASKSYGIEVARLAGIPAPVVERARQIVNRLERKQLNLTGQPRSSTINGSDFAELQQALF
ncbi:MAG TPA: DNA mismatch repair protein MutS [Acidobacteriota bacterium]|nr:DNA mismatch repair protein MutS [Acidobacteriota bacterium]